MSPSPCSRFTVASCAGQEPLPCVISPQLAVFTSNAAFIRAVRPPSRLGKQTCFAGVRHEPIAMLQLHCPVMCRTRALTLCHSSPAVATLYSCESRSMSPPPCSLASAAHVFFSVQSWRWPSKALPALPPPRHHVLQGLLPCAENPDAVVGGQRNPIG